MRSILLIFTILVSNLFFAQENMPLPNPYTWVSDQAGIFKDHYTLTHAMKDWQTKYSTGVEIALVSVKDLEGYSIVEYATNLGNKWGVGKEGSNNGLVILFAPNEHRWGIATGYGTEIVIPDGLQYDIEKECINKEEFKQGIFDPSVLRIINYINKEIVGIENAEKRAERLAQIKKWKQEQQALQDKKDREVHEAFMNFLGYLLVFGIIGFIIYAIYSTIKKRRDTIKKWNDIKVKVKNYTHPYQDYSKYLLIQNLNNYHSEALEIIKTRPFWTNNIIKKYNLVLQNYNSILDCVSLLNSRLKYKELINKLDTNIKNNIKFKVYTDNELVKTLHKNIKVSQYLDLNDDLKSSYERLNNEYREIDNIIETKNTILNLVKEYKNSNLSTKWIKHPGVSKFLNDITVYNDVELNHRIHSINEQLIEYHNKIKNDISLREIIENKGISIEKNEKLDVKAREINTRLDFKSSISELNLCTQHIQELNIARQSMSDMSENVWNQIKSIYSQVSKMLAKHENECNVVFSLEKQCNEASIKNNGLKNSILEKINYLKRYVSKSGVSSVTKRKANSIIDDYNKLNLNPLSGLEIIKLYKTLSVIINDLDNLLIISKREHNNYLDLQSKIESSISTPVFSISSSNSSSSDNYGGGKFGGGGFESSW